MNKIEFKLHFIPAVLHRKYQSLVKEISTRNLLVDHRWDVPPTGELIPWIHSIERIAMTFSLWRDQRLSLTHVSGKVQEKAESSQGRRSKMHQGTCSYRKLLMVAKDALSLSRGNNKNKQMPLALSLFRASLTIRRSIS